LVLRVPDLGEIVAFPDLRDLALLCSELVAIEKTGDMSDIVLYADEWGVAVNV